MAFRCPKRKKGRRVRDAAAGRKRLGRRRPGGRDARAHGRHDTHVSKRDLYKFTDARGLPALQRRPRRVRRHGPRDIPERRRPALRGRRPAGRREPRERRRAADAGGRRGRRRRPEPRRRRRAERGRRRRRRWTATDHADAEHDLENCKEGNYGAFGYDRRRRRRAPAPDAASTGVGDQHGVARKDGAGRRRRTSGTASTTPPTGP